MCCVLCSAALLFFECAVFCAQLHLFLFFECAVFCAWLHLFLFFLSVLRFVLVCKSIIEVVLSVIGTNTCIYLYTLYTLLVRLAMLHLQMAKYTYCHKREMKENILFKEM